MGCCSLATSLFSSKLFCSLARPVCFTHTHTMLELVLNGLTALLQLFFIANLQPTPPMTSKHTPKTKRTHQKQKSATRKRKKERKKRKSNILIFCQQPSTCSFPLQAYFRLEAIFNLSISDLSKQCRLGISLIEHLQI